MNQSSEERAAGHRNGRSDERGAALLIVIIVSLLAASIAIGYWTASRVSFLGAKRRIAAAQAQHLARSLVQAVPGWFHEVEVGALLAPPGVDDVERDLRQVDPDDDGRFVPWESADPPWNVRYKEGETENLFRPPLSSEPDARFAGSRDGPDVLLEKGGVGESYLEEWMQMLEPELPLAIRSVRIFRPYRGRPREIVATVAVEVSRRIAGGREVVRRVEAQIVKTFFERFDRPLLAEGDAEFSGAASWGHGEAVIGGDLHASESTWRRWPGGVPWKAIDQPLLDDSDADGTADDADADGNPDLSAWRDLPGAVPDPWWRARVGGNWPDLGLSPSACEAPFPFGPRADPPMAASKTEDRSGIFLNCPSANRESILPGAWMDLAKRGVRGALHAVEDEQRPGFFRRDGLGEPLLPKALLGGHRGLLWLELRVSDEVSLTLDGASGAVLVSGGDLRVRGRETGDFDSRVPGDLADFGGQDRADLTGDRRLDASPTSNACSAWEVGRFLEAGDAGLDPTSHACSVEAIHFRGLLAAERILALDGPAVIRGQVRGGELRFRAETQSVSVQAEASARFDTLRWPGPESVPRFFASEIRDSH